MASKIQFHGAALQAARRQYLQQQQFAQQQTVQQAVITPKPFVESPLTPVPTMEISPMPVPEIFAEENAPGAVPPRTSSSRKKFVRIAVIVLSILLAGTLYLIWHSSAQSSTLPGITQQSYGSTDTISISSTTPGIHGTVISITPIGSTTSSGNIEVYVAGAVKHPGVYTLPTGARIYQLLQAAGGALSNANLVALNLASRLVDGQEVYVLAVGEIPPASVGGAGGSNGSGTGTSNGNGTPVAGQPVNINTASSDQLRQGLHVSSTTAQKIIDYRTQHGPFTSIDQLLQVVSRSIYDRIKGMVTI